MGQTAEPDCDSSSRIWAKYCHITHATSDGRIYIRPVGTLTTQMPPQIIAFAEDDSIVSNAISYSAADRSFDTSHVRHRLCIHVEEHYNTRFF